MNDVVVTLEGDRPTQPLRRLLLALDIAGGEMDVRILAHQVNELQADLTALLDVIEAVRGLRRYPANTVSAEVYEMRLDAALAALKRSDEG